MVESSCRLRDFDSSTERSHVADINKPADQSRAACRDTSRLAHVAARRYASAALAGRFGHWTTS